MRSVSAESRPTRGLESWYFHGAVFELDTGESTIEWALGPFDDVGRLIAIVTPHPP